jgi:hypothetical protein
LDHKGDLCKKYRNIYNVSFKKIIGDLLQVSGFSPITPVPSTNKTDHHDIAEILLKVA